METINSKANGAGEFTDTTASPEHIYYYKVRAVAGDATSGFSNEAVVEIPGPPAM